MKTVPNGTVPNGTASAQRADCDGALVGLGQYAVLVEDTAGCAAYT